jgi:hypothetical protein
MVRLCHRFQLQLLKKITVEGRQHTESVLETMPILNAVVRRCWRVNDIIIMHKY